MRFSVVVPVYNVKDYLEKCVESVLNQKCRDYEMILVDDGSTDGVSGALCDECATEHPDIVRVVHKSNGGLGDARNVGLEAASGDYLVFVDSDDHIAPDMLETLSGEIDKTHADIYTFGFCVETDGRITQTHFDALPENEPFTLGCEPRLLLAAPNAWSRIWKRSLFETSGIRYPKRVWYEDIRTTMKLFAAAESVVMVKRAFYFYVVRSDSITHNTNVERNGEIIDAFQDLLGWYRERGLFEKYENELCMLAIDHLFIAASVRVLTVDKKNALLPRFREFMEDNFPRYRDNPYLPELAKKHRMVFNMLCRGQYGMIAMMFGVKGKISG